MPGNNSDKKEKENLHSSSSSFVPSEAMLRQAEKTREKMRNSRGASGGSKPGSVLERRGSNGALSTTTRTSKGKSYKSKSERVPKEMSKEEYFLKNKIRDTKNGSRNARMP